MALEMTVLEDEYVALIPMQANHIGELHSAGSYPDIWRWTTGSYCQTLESTERWVEECLDNARLGAQAPYAIKDKLKNKIVGSSSYLNILLTHKTIEIGYTFLTPSAQRSHINRRCKLLLLSHAFDTLKLNRVAFQTHHKNQRSRTAILALGATFEGIHRDCRIQQDGSVRSSAIYSIIKPEWPQVNSKLRTKLIKLTPAHLEE